MPFQRRLSGRPTSGLLPVSLLATLGRERFLANKHLIDRVIAMRIESGLEVKASDHLALEYKRAQSILLPMSVSKALMPGSAQRRPPLPLRLPSSKDPR